MTRWHADPMPISAPTTWYRVRAANVSDPNQEPNCSATAIAASTRSCVVRPTASHMTQLTHGMQLRVLSSPRPRCIRCGSLFAFPTRDLVKPWYTLPLLPFPGALVSQQLFQRLLELVESLHHVALKFYDLLLHAFHHLVCVQLSFLRLDDGHQHMQPFRIDKLLGEATLPTKLSQQSSPIGRSRESFSRCEDGLAGDRRHASFPLTRGPTAFAHGRACRSTAHKQVLLASSYCSANVYAPCADSRHRPIAQPRTSPSCVAFRREVAEVPAAVAGAAVVVAATEAVAILLIL
mmetsp:Transcript_30716/g.84113  ORF Transcript_30716/g.84113 Transcript_30716/m.84113 type:complete len:292 (-) Transcript_30716:1984-2859(-)